MSQMDAFKHTIKPDIQLAVVTETWLPEINGVAHTLNHLVLGLLKSGRYQIQLIRPLQGLQHQAAAAHPCLQEHFVRGLTLPFYPAVRLGLPQYFFLKRLWKKQRPDIVQIVTEGPLGYAAVHAARALNIPVFSDFHTHFDQYSRYYRLSLLVNLGKRYLRHIHNLTALTLVPTNELYQQLAQSGYRQLGIMTRGIDNQLFNPQRRHSDLRMALGIRPEQLLVVLVARMAQEKNLDLAFAAFCAIQKQQPDAAFLLVGDGPERQRLQAQHPDCHFVGMKRGIELAEHYACGDLFLAPSTSETFGNVVTEAMASGLPVVAFDYAAAHEYIRNGENSFVVPLYDNKAFIKASLALAHNPAMRRHFSQQACQSVRYLSWENTVSRLDNTIRQLLMEAGNEVAASA